MAELILAVNHPCSRAKAGLTYCKKIKLNSLKRFSVFIATVLFCRHLHMLQQNEVK